ncbi:hypothetical protein MGSAQ_003029 [marine sediment metagenome]|uniref:Uncharacterized protein n=1 Tax=marine sediment metagenome TaxID=412755 RepID=A0A1B6NPX5_9ZZZZ
MQANLYRNDLLIANVLYQYEYEIAGNKSQTSMLVVKLHRYCFC